jgi:hypothetical protein
MADQRSGEPRRVQEVAISPEWDDGKAPVWVHASANDTSTPEGICGGESEAA